MKSRDHRPVVMSDEYYLAGVGVAWSTDGMDFDSGEGENYGVGGVYVVVAGAGGERHLTDWEKELDEARASGEGLDLTSVLEVVWSRGC
jgi:hypothetical protein